MEQDEHGAVQWQPSSGFIDRLEVCNFKSYRGHQEIGPFRSFTAVVGPNGSGKSNLMDAISFVLGVRTAQLRGSLKELLYRNSDGNTEEDQPRRGYVKLVYCTNGKAVTFSRHIQPSSSDPDATYQSIYKVDDRTGTWDAYSQRLGSFGILVKVRNFLVFQGDIEAVAAKSPQGLTALFEQISGSEAYKMRYEELQKAVTKADEKVSVAFARKKSVAAERKQKKEQKEEAERYLAAQQQLRDLHVEYILFKLFHLRAEHSAAVAERDSLAEELAKVQEEHAGFEEQVSALKRRAAGHAKERLLVEKRIMKLQGERDKKVPELTKAKEAARRLAASVKMQEKEIAELEGKAQARDDKLAQLDKDLKAIAKARSKLEAQVKAHYAEHSTGAGAGLQADEVQEEYASIKAEVAAKTAKLEGERDTLATQLKADQDALEAAEVAQQSVRTRAESLRQQAEEARARAVAAEHDAKAARKEALVQAKQRTQAEDALRLHTTERAHIIDELDKAAAAVREAGADRKEARREARLTEAVDALRRLYPNGVYGRLTNLARVPRRDYFLALSVAMGRNMDAVVVDCDRTARDAIQYLKDQQVPPMTFIPLASVKVQPVAERLRTGLGGTARLALDLVEPERPEFIRAFQFAFSNTIVCDTVEEARTLAYGGHERHKVVSKDGTVFNKAGLITGGDAGNLRDKSGRWDDNRAAELKTKQQELATKLQGMPPANNLKEAVASAAQALANSEATAAAKDGEAKASRERAERAGREAAALESHPVTKSADTLRKSVTIHTAQLEALTVRIHDVEDGMFAPFSKRLGVESIRAYEEAHAAFEADTARQRADLTKKETKCKNQAEFERTKDFALDARKHCVEKDATRLRELEAQVATVANDLDALGRGVEGERQALAVATTQVEKTEAELVAVRKRNSGLGVELAKLARAQGGAETAAATAKANARDLVAAAELEQVILPRVAGAAALRAVATAMEVDGEDADEEGEGAHPGSGAEAAQGSSQAGSVFDGLDFSHLPSKLKQASSQKERDTIDRVLKGRQGELKTQLDTGAPNLKAMDQYEAVKEKERDMVTLLDEARLEASELQASFNRCRQSRLDAFTVAFGHISSEIDVIYKELTRSGVHPLGGTAYLSLEQPDEPYMAGIKYTAMPPTKRFRDMEQLSGGEKTVAALALLFALHSFRPSPFFVLDEVDAALDATNVARVAHYIRDKTRIGETAAVAGSDVAEMGTRFQSIVISLKDVFYEKADALVGVARDVELGCSRTFTFDLSAFGEPLPADR